MPACYSVSNVRGSSRGEVATVEATASVADLASQPDGTLPGQLTLRRVTAAYVAVASHSRDSQRLVQGAQRAAKLQGATRWRRVAELLTAFEGRAKSLSASVASVGRTAPWNLTFVADLICRRLDELGEEASQVLESAVRLHPGRWRFALRQIIPIAGASEGLKAARILELVGEKADIPRLRTFARTHRRLNRASQVGRMLARRLADRAWVEDQSRVAIVIAERQVAGPTVRRKVLALLCFLLTRPTSRVLETRSLKRCGRS